MPRKRSQPLHPSPDRIQELANDPRYEHTFWSFPSDHPIVRHDGPGIIVLANPKRRHAYVLAARTQTVHKAAVALIGRLRHYLRDLNGDAHHLAASPDRAKPPHPGSLDLPHWLAKHWDSDTPEGFTWLLADPFPPLYHREFGMDKTGKSDYKAVVRQRKDAVSKTLVRHGWSLYNPPAIRGASRRGAALAWYELDASLDAEYAHNMRNHLDWATLLVDNSIGLDPRHNPREPNVQRAFARYQYLNDLPLPRPGGPMRGHKSTDTYTFSLPYGEFTIDYIPDCQRCIDWAKYTSLAY